MSDSFVTFQRRPAMTVTPAAAMLVFFVIVFVVLLRNVFRSN
jgi:hypothetical protein